MSEFPENETSDGLRERLQKQGEETLGQLAAGLLESPLVHKALAGAFDAREKATQAQEAAMGALNLPSAADLERLTRRVRSLSQRLEGIEDGVDKLDERLAALPGAGIEERLGGIEERLGGIEAAQEKLGNEVEALRKKLPATPPKRAAPKRAAAKKAAS
jgi:predicted  nucleic acid-binding Zn-ribbon protein